MTLPDKFKFTCETEIPPHSIVYTAKVVDDDEDIYAVSWIDGGNPYYTRLWRPAIELAINLDGWAIHVEE